MDQFSVGAHRGTFTGTYSAAMDGVPVLTNGQAVSISGTTGSVQYWKIDTCMLASTSAGDYDITVRGYTACSGVSLKASY